MPEQNRTEQQHDEQPAKKSRRDGWTDEQRRREYERVRAKKSMISCQLDRTVADQFRAYAAEHGTSVNALLTKFVTDTLNSND